VIKDLKAGDPVSVGPYKLLGRLGAGGMGQVYLAKSPGGRLVAIKLIRPELAEERGFRTRFAGEIAAARNVSGIYTAAVVDADAEAELPWMATVYVPGPSLTDAVEDSGPLPVKSVLALAAGLAEALQAIHRADLVHRDMKPSNVLLAVDGPRVIDFGISRALERSMMTTTGMVLGSPGFMSPEQAMGEQVGKPSDVFSLGAILAYAATGAGPFGSGPTPALLYRVVREEPDLSQVPAELRPLIQQCLAKDPAARPTTAGLLTSLSDDVEVITGEWLPQAIADGMSRYRPTLQTPLPPSLREPDSVPVEPLPASSEPAAVTGPSAGEPARPAVGSAAVAPPGGESVAARPATPGPATPVPANPAPATALAAAAVPVAATVAEYSLPETSLVSMPGGSGGRGVPVAAGGAAGAQAGLPPRRRRRRWPAAAAAAAVVIIAVVAALVLLRSPGSASKNGPAPTPSLAGDMTSAAANSASGTATQSKNPGKPSASTPAGNAPGTQSSAAPSWASSSAAAKTWTPTPTTSATPTATTTPTPTATTATATSSPTATSAPTSTPPALPTAPAPTPAASSS
jgi:eukaryotic-like serine/threonine-protein kinase